MHEPWDENYQRGYEWWLMTEAKKVFSSHSDLAQNNAVTVTDACKAVV